MAEIISFEKAKKNLDDKLRSILNRKSDTEQLIKKCCGSNELVDERDDLLGGKVYQVDEHTKITLWDDGGYIIAKTYSGGSSC